MTKFGPLPVVPDVARFQLHTQATGGPVCLTRFYMKYSLAMSGPDATTLLGTLAGAWNANLGPNTGANYSLIAVTLDDLASRTGVQSTLVTSHPGTATSPGVSAGVAFVMSARTSLKYRGGHSRVYIPGMTTSGLSDVNTWSVTFQGTVFTAWTTMLSALATSPPTGVGTLTQVTVRYISSNKNDFPPSYTGGFPGLLPSPMVLGINSWASNPQAGSQRRRNQQGG